MENQVLLAKIGIIVTEISDQHRSLSAGSGILPEADLEICLANSRLLLEYVEVLQKLNRALPQALVIDPVVRVFHTLPPAQSIPPALQPADQARNIHSVLSEATMSSTVLNKLDKRPVRHLHEGISLNQRLLFIRALFNGNADVYERTLGSLENFKTLDEALDYVDTQVGPAYDWASKESQVGALKELLTRRFS